MKTVLVVDDELGYREMLQMDLSEAGFRVLTAAGGQEALDTLQREDVDLVLTDMKMPKMDGLETVVAIKKLRPELPIILMTGYAVEDMVQKALSLKARLCLRKPFDTQDLTTAIQDVLPS